MTTPAAPLLRVWIVLMPFTKGGVPVVGSCGKTRRGVILMPAETWAQLCADIPALAAVQFEVNPDD